MGGELGYRFGWVALVVAVKDGGNMETNIYSACSEAFCISLGVSGSTSIHSEGHGIIWLGRIYGI